MKNKKTFRALTFKFESMEPGEVATIESSDTKVLSPRRVVINRSAFALGAEYDDLAIDGTPYTTRPFTSNPTYLEGADIPAGAKIELSLRNSGDKPVRPVAFMVFEIVNA